MQLIEIRRQLEDLTAPGVTPDRAHVSRLRAAWEGIKGTVPTDYHPIIDDRLMLIERQETP